MSTALAVGDWRLLSVLMVNEVVERTGDVDGIDDYAARLCEALGGAGVEVERARFRPWDFRSLVEARRRVEAGRFDLVHVQLSSYGSSPTLELFALSQRAVVTVHEWTQLGLYQRVKWLPTLARPKAAIFTNGYEREAAKRWLRIGRPRTSVMPIGTNIAVAGGVEREAATVASFGVIRPNRGWEAFIEAAQIAKRRGHGWSFRALGGVPTYVRRYAGRLRRSATGLNLAFSGALDDSEMARELAAGTVGLFLFPDGASDRRGSLLAAMANGLPIVTTDGPQLSSGLRECVATCGSPADAVRVVQRLMEDEGERRRLSEAGRAYMAERTWPRIAEGHRELYERVLGHG